MGAAILRDSPALPRAVARSKAFDGPVGTPLLADLNGDGKAEAIVGAGDGLVHVLGPWRNPGGRGSVRAALVPTWLGRRRPARMPDRTEARPRAMIESVLTGRDRPRHPLGSVARGFGRPGSARRDGRGRPRA